MQSLCLCNVFAFVFCKSCHVSSVAANTSVYNRQTVQANCVTRPLLVFLISLHVKTKQYISENQCEIRPWENDHWLKDMLMHFRAQSLQLLYFKVFCMIYLICKIATYTIPRVKVMPYIYIRSSNVLLC